MKNTFLFILGILLVCVLEGWGQNPPCRISGEVEGVKKGDLFVLAIADDVSGAVKKNRTYTCYSGWIFFLYIAQ